VISSAAFRRTAIGDLFRWKKIAATQFSLEKQLFICCFEQTRFPRALAARNIICQRRSIKNAAQPADNFDTLFLIFFPVFCGRRLFEACCSRGCELTEMSLVV